MDSLTDQDSGLIKRLGRGARRARRAIAPGRRAWRGAAWGALIALTAIMLVAANGLFGQAAPAHFLIGAVLFLATFAIVGSLVALVWRILKGIPAFYSWVLACAVPVLALLALTAMGTSIGIVTVGLGTLALTSLVGAGIAALVRGGWSQLTWLRRAVAVAGLVLGLVGLVAGGVWLLDDGSPLAYPTDAMVQVGTPIEPLDLPDPSQPGPYTVRTLFYGNGVDRHRPEYGPDVDLVTSPVDGSALVERWSGLRTAYWGFGPEAMPLNGRVWYPENKGACPLVMIVHGQHPMEEDSDPGYAYLGELLASRGFVVVSVDENFLNLSPLVDLVILSSLQEEDDLRGWLLLEHLRLWRDWNASPGNPFYQRVNMEEIALVGHSRGGEAVAVAAAFNRLPFYPDNAAVRFDYGFDIRALVAFAPADGQYQPTGRAITLEDINYLVLHGVHDMDVFTFQGARQFARVRFPGTGDWFKAGLYIYGANHGQFNTVWGRKDLFEPVMRVFNLEQLLPARDQQQIAKVYVSAFLEATLYGKTGYRPLFRDPRRGRAWLPDTIYLSQYQDSNTQLVSTYEEDIDLATTTLLGGSLTGNNLAVWREQPAKAKWGDLGDQAVYLGWATSASAEPASYTIELPERGLKLSQESVLVFSLADAGENPTPNVKGDETGTSRVPVDLTLEVEDRAGEVAKLPLSHFSFLQPQLEGTLGKAAFMSSFPPSEAVFQSFEYPLADFVAANLAFEPASLVRVRLIFDRSESGVVVLDDFGFRH